MADSIGIKIINSSNRKIEFIVTPKRSNYHGIVIRNSSTAIRFFKVHLTKVVRTLVRQSVQKG